MTLWKTLVVALVAAFALAACSSSSDNNAAMGDDPPPVVDTTVDDALAAIAAAATAEDAQAAYDEVKDDVTATEGERLQAAVNARIMVLDAADRANTQRNALAEAAGAIDTSDLSTQALVDAARAAIATLRGALAAAADVDDTSMYEGVLDRAVDAVDTAQGGIDTDTRRTNQMTALSDASGTLQAALTALSGSTPTQAQLDTANNALTALNTAIADGADLTDDEKAPYQREAGNAAAPIRTAQVAFDTAEDEDEKTRNAAMAVTAAKLYAGIGTAPLTTGTIGGTEDGTRTAAYSGTGDSDISVTFDPDLTAAGDTNVTQALKADDMTVAANHGWDGKRYTATTTGGDMYEAYVYSNVEDPTMGRKFGSTDAVTATGAFEYQVAGTVTDATAAVQTGELTISTTIADQVASRVVLTGVTRTVGTETFRFSEDEATDRRIDVPGSYHGVSGTYWCTPTTRANGCSADVAADGFTLADGTWAFKPGDPNARVRDSEDADYASYGWWLRKAANDGPFIASAFVDNKGTAPTDLDATETAALRGTARYMGGAAGKYALSSSTGGTNDAGHFTARATLNATFATVHKITGTIDSFIGKDGESRDWSVKLNESAVSSAGAIAGALAADGTLSTTNTGPQMTVWTIGDRPAAASGQWSGSLQEAGDDHVPQVATGTFYTEFGTAGRMVGAFGANKQ